jgi:hypothetical protein
MQYQQPQQVHQMPSGPQQQQMGGPLGGVQSGYQNQMGPGHGGPPQQQMQPQQGYGQQQHQMQMQNQVTPQYRGPPPNQQQQSFVSPPRQPNTQMQKYQHNPNPPNPQAPNFGAGQQHTPAPGMVNQNQNQLPAQPFPAPDEPEFGEFNGI